jgi:hypothetical protein
LALYRRYRPETFAEVLGQDHVTTPLRQALAHNRVHHAYLFSGPRGCGKTTSARILARTLNCEQFRLLSRAVSVRAAATWPGTGVAASTSSRSTPPVTAGSTTRVTCASAPPSRR